MRIAEAALRSGLSVDTIRYYEKSGIVPEIRRGSDRQRRFSEENIEWLTLLFWLHETGMPMKTMYRFASLYRVGDHFLASRELSAATNSTVLPSGSWMKMPRQPIQSKTCTL